MNKDKILEYIKAEYAKRYILRRSLNADNNEILTSQFMIDFITKFCTEFNLNISVKFYEYIEENELSVYQFVNAIYDELYNSNDILAAIDDIIRLTKIEPKGIKEKVLKFNEEFGEFNAELIKYFGLSSKPYSREHLVEECADVLQMLISLFCSIEAETGITLTEIAKEILVKDKKWEDSLNRYSNHE